MTKRDFLLNFNDYFLRSQRSLRALIKDSSQLSSKNRPIPFPSYSSPKSTIKQSKNLKNRKSFLLRRLKINRHVFKKCNFRHNFYYVTKMPFQMPVQSYIFSYYIYFYRKLIIISLTFIDKNNCFAQTVWNRVEMMDQARVIYFD